MFVIQDTNLEDISTGTHIQTLKEGVLPKDAFEFNTDAYNAKQFGLWTHTNVRKDKFDCFPQPELVEMLKQL